MPEYLAPGVYIEEVDLGPVPIQGVQTSAGGIIGLCQRGPIDTITLCTSPGDFTTTFGGPLPPGGAPMLHASYNNVAYGAQAFFANGGTTLYVVRVAPTTATPYQAAFALNNAGGVELWIQAAYSGSWGNPQYGVLYGRYQQTDGLSFTLAAENTLPYKVQAGSTASQVNLLSTVGLYVGAVLSWSTNPSTTPNQYTGVVSALTDTTVMLANVPFGAAPPTGTSLTLLEFALGVNFLQGGQVAQSETWHHLNVNAATNGFIGTVVGTIGSATGGSQLVRAGLSGSLNFSSTAAYGPTGTPSPWPSLMNVSGTSAVVSGLTDGTAYTFTVAATSSVGTSPAANPVTATPTAASAAPGTPSGVSATAGDGSVTLSWTPVGGATSYDVYEAATSGGETTPTYTGITGSSTPVSGLTNGTEYFFTVTAVNAGGASAQSAEVHATPLAPTAPPIPTALAATVGDTQIALTWDAASGATSYEVNQGTTSGGETALQSVTGTSFISTGLTNGTRYYFTVTASNAAGTSAPSAEVSATPASATTAPSAPAGLTATAGNGQVTLSWNPVAGAATYAVLQGTSAGGESGTPVQTGITGLSTTVGNLNNGTTYYFKVVAVNGSGTSPASNEASAQPVSAAAPAAPTGLAAAAADGQVTLSWDASTGATSYAVFVTAAGDDGLATLNQATYNALFNDPSLDTDDPATRGGIYAFQNVRGMMMIAMPGNTDPEVQSDLLALCQNDGYKFAVLDPAPTIGQYDWHEMDASISDIIAQRGSYDSEYGALYYPWVCIEDPFPPNPNNVGYVNISPSGFQMGVTARVDINRGVFKAPANEVVQTALAFSHVVDQGTQDVLNPLGIDCFRDFTAENYGLRIWGARTVSSNSAWKYINVRRLFQYIEASIEYGTQWVVFEPNNALTWARVRTSVTDFLTDTWRSGALMGSKPSEAFYVLCDYPDTMTISQVQNGQLICEIGIAPTYPAEFVIFRISQWTGGAGNGG